MGKFGCAAANGTYETDKDLWINQGSGRHIGPIGPNKACRVVGIAEADPICSPAPDGCISSAFHRPSLNRNHDFPKMCSARQITKSLRRLGEREHPVDHRLEPVLR